MCQQCKHSFGARLDSKLKLGPEEGIWCEDSCAHLESYLIAIAGCRSEHQEQHIDASTDMMPHLPVYCTRGAVIAVGTEGLTPV